MTTKGLSNYGLPELQAHNIPPQLGEFWTPIISGLAWRIIQEFGNKVEPGSKITHYDIPADVDVSAADIGEAYHDNTVHGGSAKIHLRLDPRKAKGDCDFLR